MNSTTTTHSPELEEDLHYYKQFEGRTPPKPLPYLWYVEALWQFLAVVAVVLGAWYLHWRWTDSLNMAVAWYALPLVIAESCAFIGLLLYVCNLWRVQDTAQKEAPASIQECVATDHPLQQCEARPVEVDIFITTYNEDTELVRHSVRDAMKVHAPQNSIVKVHVLDDGNRLKIAKMANEEGAHYLTRQDNAGFKAGNLRNAIYHTSGDIIVICDADTRLYPDFLQNTLGYFRDPKVSWVQTPQWFYDVPEGETLTEKLARRAGRIGRFFGKHTEDNLGDMRFGHDPFCNDFRVFYDIIQRRRNCHGASFCCGAASLHRREAVMGNAITQFTEGTEASVQDPMQRLSAHYGRTIASDASSQIEPQKPEMMPYKFHVSEDIYTSIYHHEDRASKWRSVYHPQVESRMLSPQDLYSWTLQRFKYAGGSLDIMLRDNPLFRAQMPWKIKLMYAATFWSYLGCIWNVVFLLGPIVYLFTGLTPVVSFTDDFFKHLIPFLVATELAFMVGSWGTSTFKNKAYYVGFFALNLKALWTVMRGEKIAFRVTPKFRESNHKFLYLVWPHMLLISLTFIGLSWACFNYFVLDNLVYGPNGMVINSFWAACNMLILWQMVKAALWKPSAEKKANTAPAPAMQGAMA